MVPHHYLRWNPKIYQWLSWDRNSIPLPPLHLVCERTSVYRMNRVCRRFPGVTSLDWCTDDVAELPFPSALLKTLRIEGSAPVHKGKWYLSQALNTVDRVHNFAYSLSQCSVLVSIEFHGLSFQPLDLLISLSAKPGSPIEVLLIVLCSCPSMGTGVGSTYMYDCFIQFIEQLGPVLRKLTWDYTLCSHDYYGSVGTSIRTLEYWQHVPPLLTHLTLTPALRDVYNIGKIVNVVMSLFGDRLFHFTLAHVAYHRVTELREMCQYWGFVVQQCQSTITGCIPGCQCITFGKHISADAIIIPDGLIRLR
jgi:hypothetical protein